jgi:tetratricopeptide (TPR) repeat protein
LADYTDMTPATLRGRVRANDAKAKRELLEVYGRFASEYDYQPVEADHLPYGCFAVDYGRRKAKRLLHSYGAIQCMEKLQDLVAEDGFILLNDYGPTHTGQDDEFEHQRFSLATFVGINFPLLKAYFSDASRGQWVAPAGEERGIHSRLLSRKPAYETVARFYEMFGEARHKHLDEPLEMARACLKAGRFEMAAAHYHEAIRRQPRNWILLNEVSMFLTFQLRDLKAGIDMAKVALTLNPTCSADLWNTLGDGLYEFGRTLEARSAYHQALAVNANDVRARYNLAWVHAREKDYSAALSMLAEAMGQDKTGLFRDRLLQKQQEVLAQMARDHQHEYLLLTNLVSRHAQGGTEPAAEVSPPQAPVDKKD